MARPTVNQDRRTQPPRIDIGQPLTFIGLCWPDMKLYSKQREILHSVRDNKETFVHACNTSGKSRIAAVTTLWFFCSRTPARVILSSTTQSQLETVLWTEIRELISRSSLPLPLDVSHLRIRKWTDRHHTAYHSLDYVVGHVTASVESFQGHHLPNDKPRVLCVFEEASGVADEFNEGAESWAHRKLVIGNPLSTTNFFYAGCKGGDRPDPSGRDALLRKVVHIDGLDSPNVKLGLHRTRAGKSPPHPILIPGLLSYDEYVIRDQEWDEIQKTMRLRGRFYEGEQALLFPPQWLDIAEAHATDLAEQKTPRRAEAMGVDTAGGRDLSVWVVVDRHGVIHVHSAQTPDTMDIVNITIQLMADFSLSPLNVVFDGGGGGKQIADRLRQLEHRVRVVMFGAGTTEVKSRARSRQQEKREARQVYKNRRAELYGTLRAVINPHDGELFALPGAGRDATLLREELQVLPLQYNEEGKLHLPPKETNATGHGKGRHTQEVTLRSLLGRSPDRADALVLAVDGLIGKKNLSLGARTDDEASSRARGEKQERMQRQVAERMAEMQQAMARRR